MSLQQQKEKVISIGDLIRYLVFEYYYYYITFTSSLHDSLRRINVWIQQEHKIYKLNKIWIPKEWLRDGDATHVASLDRRDFSFR